MARTTQTDIAGILSFTADDVTPFITAANSIINRLVVPDTSLSDDDLKMLETWLAAHFIQVSEPPVSSESVSGPGGGGVNRSYRFSVSQKFSATVYGQQAMVMDDTGNLQPEDENGFVTVGLEAIDTYEKVEDYVGQIQ